MDEAAKWKGLPSSKLLKQRVPPTIVRTAPVTPVVVAHHTDSVFQTMECVIHRPVNIGYVTVLPQQTGAADLVMEVTIGLAQFLEVVTEMTAASAAFHLSVKVFRRAGQPMAVDTLVGVARGAMDLPMQMLSRVGEAVCGGSDIRRVGRHGRAADCQCREECKYRTETHGNPPVGMLGSGPYAGDLPTG